MPNANHKADALGLFLTGASASPDSSLGGALSTRRIRGLGSVFSNTIPGIRVDNVLPACGEGVANLHVDADGFLVFTPPDGLAGDPVEIAVGESRLVAGQDKSKAIRVFREDVLPVVVGKQMAMVLRRAFNGALAQANVTSAQRVAGVTTYRAIALSAQGPYQVQNIRLWLPPVSGTQATFAIGLETPVAGAIQTVANENTAPSGVVFTSPTTEGAALTIPILYGGEWRGLWIRRVFPAAGAVDPRENFQLAVKFLGA